MTLGAGSMRLPLMPVMCALLPLVPVICAALLVSACGSTVSAGPDAGSAPASAEAGSDSGAVDPGDGSFDSGAATDTGTDASPSMDTGIVGDGATNDALSTDGASSGGAVRYSTDFDLTESPISENGAWTNVGLDWTLVDTSGGIAYGTQTGQGGYDDSYAHLSGFPPDQSASAVIHRDASIDGSCTHEVEILLHWSDAPHDAHGYECNLAFDGSYAQIVRWNGAKSDFTYLAGGSVAGGVHDGDTLSASIVGDLITLSVNGTAVTHATDATFANGNPGMAFWRGSACGTRGDYGFTSYAATSGP